MPKNKPKAEKSRVPRFLQKYIAEGRVRAERYLANRPHRSFKITPTPTYRKGKTVAGFFELIFGTFKTIYHEKKVLLPLGLLFIASILVVVGAISQINFVEVRQATQDLFSGNLGAAGSVITLFNAAISGSLNPSISPLQQLLAVLLIFLFWLSLLWALRKRFSDQPVTAREALYNSGGPIVPTFVVALAIIFQCIPGALGIIGAALTFSGIWVQGGVESMLIAVAAGLLCTLSLYWIGGSALALVIITLPGMYPWRALSAASDLVIGQRWRLILRFLSMAAVVVVVWSAVLFPILLLDGWLKFNWLPLIPVFVLLLYGFTLVYCSTFIYKMYRSML